MSKTERYDIVIVGAGPAGIAAAHAVAGGGRRIALVDDNPFPGGQIWRGGKGVQTEREALKWLNIIENAKVERLYGLQVVAAPEPNKLLVESAEGGRFLRYDKLILATGAREQFLPFPGWTLPNVLGSGAMQSLLKSKLPVEGKRAVVAGSGPLMFAVADYLKSHGATVLFMAEQAPFMKMVPFGVQLPFLSFHKVIQAIDYQSRLFLRVPYKHGCWPIAAEGKEKLCRATFQQGGKTFTVDCDYLACGFGFVPNVELPVLLGCNLQQGYVAVDPRLETSVKGVYCAGEPTGIGGVDKSLIEGHIAGNAAIGNLAEVEKYQAKREKALKFARAMDTAFALRDELKSLARPETLVCRCEDVKRGDLEKYPNWRAAKLHTRCGMGSCQGRICGTITPWLMNWGRESLRPPVFPTTVATLAQSEEE